MTEQIDLAGKWLRDLANRMQREIKADAAPSVEKITVRQFLERFGYHRRRQRVVGEIREKLEGFGLRTSPDFEYEYIDDEICIELDSPAQNRNPADPTVRIGILKAAHSVPISVKPDDLLVTAISQMRMNDYSQLPVMTTETVVKGVVSWRSIGVARANGSNPQTVKECVEKEHEVEINTLLADATESICKHGYVLVRGEKNQITGIVTGEDLAVQFKKLAHPFLLVGEIEHHLRNLIRGMFTVDELAEASEGTKTVKGPDDLSFGDYGKLLEKPESWARLGLDIDRKVFVARLEKIRGIRNEVMHFSPDDHEFENIELLERSARFLRELSRSHNSIPSAAQS